MRSAATTTIKSVNPISNGPIVDSAKACTEEITPERVRNVPKIEREKVAVISATFQDFIMPRFSWTHRV